MEILQDEQIFAVAKLDLYSAFATFNIDKNNQVYIFYENQLIGKLDNYYFPVFSLLFHKFETASEPRYILFIACNDVHVAYCNVNLEPKCKVIAEAIPDVYCDCIL